MAPRISFKADSSFFEKIVIGVVGAGATCRYLETLGHSVAELERGALSTKLWKDVKRKRVRIPDLVCTRCGQRVEVRAKTRAEISMSHSPNDAERAWDFGMVGADWVAFPVCNPAGSRQWVQGSLKEGSSYWHERKWSHWESQSAINIFRVGDLRAAELRPKPAKGVTEGSETQVFWPAAFAKSNGQVTHVDSKTVRYSLGPGMRERFIKLGNRGREMMVPDVSAGQSVILDQILAGVVPRVQEGDLACPGGVSAAAIQEMLGSRERTVRYTGCRLAKLLGLKDLRRGILDLAGDPAEDLYTRLEARSYLVTVAGQEAHSLFAEFLDSRDGQLQLEGIVTLADTHRALLSKS